MNAIQTKVIEQIGNISPKVENAVVEILVDRELVKRSRALVIVIDMLSEAEGQLRKMKPDQVFYDADGKETASAFSKAKNDESKKLKEKIAKFEKAIDKAISGDFSDVYNIQNSGKGGKGNSEETPDGDS